MSATKESTVDKTTKDRRIPAKAIPVLVFSSVLSVASLGWTTYSLLDLLKAGAIGLTVAATADLIWSSVIWCEYKGIGHRGWVKFVGWVAVVVVGSFIAWHGVSKDSVAMAVAGPFLTLGTKAVWEFALMALKDPVTEVKANAKKEIDLLNAETDTILKKAHAEIRKEDAEKEADHKRKLSEKRREHELKMAELTYEQEEKRAASEHRGELLASTLENTQFERIMAVIERTNKVGGTIPGEVVPQQEVAPQSPRKELSSNPQAAVQAAKEIVTVSLGEDGEILTDAQKNRRRLAALYYLMSDAAADRGEKLSQTAYALRMGKKKAQISRSVNEFPREEIGDIEMYREDLDQLGETG